MADQQQPVEGDDEPLELTDVVDPNEGDDDNDNRSDDDDSDPNVNDEAEGETVVAFEGEEPEAEPENSTVRQMRQALREKDKRIKELEQSSAPKPIEVGEKPTLAGCDYDEDKFAEELEAFKDREAAAKRQSATQAEQSRKANEEWQADLGAFEQEKAGLDFPDRDEAIETATSSLDMVQQAVIVKAAAKPALFMVALGKSEAKRAELAKIQDPIKLAAAVARMEGAVKVTTRKAPTPDKPLSGTARMPGSADKEIERLEKKAAANGGDRSELIAYKAKLAAKK
jgi:hypothetical protein